MRVRAARSLTILFPRPARRWASSGDIRQAEQAAAVRREAKRLALKARAGSAFRRREERPLGGAWRGRLRGASRRPAPSVYRGRGTERATLGRDGAARTVRCIRCPTA